MRAIRFILLILLFPSSTWAEEVSQFHLDASQSIVYCDISPSFNQEQWNKALHDGNTVRFAWRFHIERIRDYWLNQDVADIHFSRQVTPDLLTGQWILHDDLTQIDLRTYDIQQAIRFLTQIHHFPLIDKSLLEPHNDYRVRVYLDTSLGQNTGWWQSLLSTDREINSITLSIP